jgi:hypothetical protein
LSIIKKVRSVHWSVWSIVIAAAINFALALETGSMANLLACLICLIGLAGFIER